MYPHANRIIARFLAWAACLTASVQLSASEPDVPAQIDFNQHIRPIFSQHCTSCHGGVKQAGDVSLIFRDQVLPPDGWIVEPGKPLDSALFERVTTTDPEMRMPPLEHGEALSKTDVAKLRRWIEQGARWSDHWAYEKPIRPEIPLIQDFDWGRQPLDAFVLARLEQENIKPSPDAPPELWLRRVYLDLIGLPPSYDERADFLTDVEQDGELAYEHVVDRLLASPRFGERWASVWLDQIRYADSKGLGQDGKRNVWKYRDWVIRAMNQDLPYDQFTIKQLAGDLLPNPTIEDYIATTSQRLTQSNEEGGTDDEEFRVAAVLDRVNTTWQVWQGVTFGCTQCHNHPYDPFRQDEYYQFAAFFNNTADSDLDNDWPYLETPIDSKDYFAAEELDRNIAAIKQRIWQHEQDIATSTDAWKPLTDLEVSASQRTKMVVETRDGVQQFHTQGTVARSTDITVISPIPESIERVTAVQVNALPLDPETAKRDSEWGFVLSNVEVQMLVPDQPPQTLELARVLSDDPNPIYDPNSSLNPKSNSGFAAYTRINYPRAAALVLKKPIDVPPGAKLKVVLKHRIFMLAAFPLVMRRGHLAVSDDERFTQLLTDEDVASLRDEMKQLKSHRSKIKSTRTPIMLDRPEQFERPTHVFIRGLFLTKEKEVSPGTPASMPEMVDDSNNRLALAHWMVSEDNPLTARVAVNRLWARMFGTGIVPTEEDFGSSGELPTHSQLLDYLAVRFQHDYYWSVKKILREVALSRTYRQSGKYREDLKDRDPNNSLLAAGPRHRLAAEIVRDQALSIAGLLSDKMYGPPVHPPIPQGVWQPFQSSDKWNTPESGKEDRYRRSVYTYTKRSIPYPMFATFDSPSREVCTPRRLRSNTPLQALMTLNDTTYEEAASAFAKRMIQHDDDLTERLKFAFISVTSREPSESELSTLAGFYQQLETTDEQERLTHVASVLLNLDEIFAK